MSILKKIVALTLLALQASWSLAEQDEEPSAPKLAPPTNEARPPSPDQSDAHVTGKLVSILKQRVPKGKVEMAQAPEWFQNLVQRIVRENVPIKYVHDKDWGKTDRRWNGLKVRREGLRLSTKRRWKEVNHGTWKRYEITQINPHRHLTLRIHDVRDAGAGHVAFDVQITSRLQVYGRTSQWAKGVRLYSISAEATCNVDLSIACQMGIRLDPKKFPPDVVLVTQVTRADLNVKQFGLTRVSKFDGPLVKQLSKSVHKVLLDKIEEKRDRLPEKINRQIAKNKDKMRLSVADFASQKWKKLTGDGERGDAAADAGT